MIRRASLRPSHSAPHGLSQQAIMHERDSLQNELARCQADLHEMQRSAARVQRGLKDSIGESDAVIQATLDRIGMVQACAKEDTESVARSIQESSRCVSKIRQRLEVTTLLSIQHRSSIIHSYILS